MKLKNIFLALYDQLTRPGAFKNFFITGNAWGIFSINSHINKHTGKEKIMYKTRAGALKSAQKMSEKKGVHFSVYKCMYCDGYHLGKNQQNKVEGYDYVRAEIYGKVIKVSPNEEISIRTGSPSTIPSHLRGALVSWGDKGTIYDLAKRYPEIVKIIN